MCERRGAHRGWRREGAEPCSTPTASQVFARSRGGGSLRPGRACDGGNPARPGPAESPRSAREDTCEASSPASCLGRRGPPGSVPWVWSAPLTLRFGLSGAVRGGREAHPHAAAATRPPHSAASQGARGAFRGVLRPKTNGMNPALSSSGPAVCGSKRGSCSRKPSPSLSGSPPSL